MRKQNMDPIAQALACLAQNYEAIFNVDFETNECENIYFRDDFEEIIRGYDPEIETRGYSGRMGLVATVAVAPEHLKGFLEATSPDYVLKKLNVNETHIVNFRTVSDSGIKNFQLKYVRNAFLGRNNVIVGLRDITDEIGENNETATFAHIDNAPNSRKASVKVEKGMSASEGTVPKKKVGDVLERVKYEGLKQTWNAFVFSMSHGLRTPLNAILGYAAMIDRFSNDTELVTDFAKKIKVSGRSMLNLLNDVIDISAFETGTVSLNMGPVDITDVLQHTSSFASEEARLKDISFTEHRIDLADRQIICDATRLEQILDNILDNALRYTNSGGRITLQTEELAPTKKGYANYKFTISDTGVGMTEEIRKHLFHSYEYEKSDRLSVVQGTGIGMAITKKLIDALGGTLEVDSELGVGTTITCTLSFQLIDNSAKSKKKVADSILVGKRILLVEDDAMNREIARLILENEHLIVEEATDGAVAVDMVYNSEPGTYNYILMDLLMPYMDGFEAAKEIRALEDKSLANIPIIALSARAFDDDRKRALSVGMNEFITKPVNIKNLIEIIKKLESEK